MLTKTEKYLWAIVQLLAIIAAYFVSKSIDHRQQKVIDDILDWVSDEDAH